VRFTTDLFAAPQARLLSRSLSSALCGFAALFALSLATPALAVDDLPDDLNIDLSSIVVSKDELICLALNDYWEARSEVMAGRIAVAKVVLNRAMDRRFPSNICDIVKQTRNRTVLHRCQFSWYCDGRSDIPYNPKAWRDSLKVATAVLQKDANIPDPTDGALWYHADFIRPAWALEYETTTIIGAHVFYRETTPSSATSRVAGRKPFIQRLNAFAEFAIARNASEAVAVASNTVAAPVDALAQP
jgi:N-acetylmuramoyl-L-alanine amidase